MQTHVAATTPTAHSLALPERRRYLTINEAAAVRPFSPAALRDIRFKAADRINSRGEVIKGNGSAAAWLTIGRKVLLDLEAFDHWLESHRGQ